MKKNIVLKGILLIIVTSIIIGIIYHKNYTAISDETVISSAEAKNFKATLPINIEDISKEQNLIVENTLVEVEELIGRYQFNMTGCGTQFAENNIGTKTGASHIELCQPYEQTFETFTGNSSAGYLDESYNVGGKIYKAYLVVEINASATSTAAKAPITLLYGGKNGSSIISGIKSTCTTFYYEETRMKQGTGWIDVTDFVKENGYGWYYGCNIPFSGGSGDDFSSWKLVVIEENVNLPVRKLLLAMGNQWLDGTGDSYIKVSGTGIRTKKTGDVTGQLLYAITNTDPCIGGNSVAYSMNDVDYIPITTTNNVRTADAPLCMVMSRNGEPIKNIAGWANHYYFTKKFEGTALKSNAIYTQTYNADYPEATGDDIELIDVSGKTDKTTVTFENDKPSLSLKFSTNGYLLATELLGVVVDIDSPEYTTVQNAVSHDTYYATISGTTKNTSTLTEGIGMHDGKIEVKVDKGLKILSTNAYFTDSNGNKTILGNDMYTIDYINNVITYIFGKDSEGRSLVGDSLTYSIETMVIESDNNDNRKYIANNEVTASGTLVSNNVNTSFYMSKVAWDDSSVTFQDPPYVIVNDIIVNPNGGIYENSTQNTIYKDVQSKTEKKISIPTKTGYTFTGWTMTGEGSSFKDNIVTMGTAETVLTANWKINSYTLTVNPNGGTWNASTQNATYTLQYNAQKTIENPTRTGYVFGGWEIIGKNSKIENLVFTMGSENAELKAKWLNIYTIKYNGNGATAGSTVDSNHVYDTAKNLTTNGFERKYTVTYNHNYTGSTNTSKIATYSFVGWANSADGIKAYDNNASVKNLTTTANGIVNLYAIWNSTSVTYVPTRDGYIFAGWYKEASCTNSVATANGVYTPTANITLYAKWTPNVYTIKYNGNGATGGTTADSIHTYDVAKNLTTNGFERKYTVTYNHNYTGSTDTNKTATYNFNGWSKTQNGTKAYDNNASVMNLTTEVNGTVNLYAVWDSASVTYVPTRAGYTFAGWYKEASCTNSVTGTDGVYTPSANITLYAKWTPRIDTEYTVRHWKQNVGAEALENSTNYTLEETEKFKGTTEAKVTPEVKTYTGFTSPATQTIVIKGDGTAEVNYYYTRNSYTVTLNNGTGISSVNGAGIYEYEEKITIDATVAPGYTWKDWTGDKLSTTKQYTFTMPASDLTITANAVANTYTVKYNGNGATGGTTADSIHTYDTAKNLTANGFERKYTVTYNHNYTGSINTSKIATYSFSGWAKSADGIKEFDNNESVKNLTTVANGTVNLYAMWNSASVTYVPTRDGYTFAGWYKETSCTNSVSGADGIYTPVANITLYAKWIANSDTEYTVKHWKQNLGADSVENSTNYSLVESENFSGITDNEVTPEVKTYTGFSSPIVQTITIKGDGTAEVNYYYTRNSYTVTLNSGTGISSVSGAESYEYEASVIIDATVNAGYTWKDWAGDKANATKQYTFTMPAKNVVITANAVANTYTVKYNGNGATAGSTAESSHVYDEEKALTTNEFERKYTVTYNHNYSESADTSKIAIYSFNGWSKTSNGAKDFDDNESVKNLTSELNGIVNLYAIWSSSSVTYIPTRAGYTFAGWYTEPEGINKVSDGEYTPASNITLYAKWEIDENQTKELNYIVEYYKDNKKVDADTQEVKITVQLLQPDTLLVDKSQINVVDKYIGYRLDKTEPGAIPDVIASGSTIKVYYTKRTDLSYTVKYKEFGTEEVLAEDRVVENQIFENTITEKAIDIKGYDMQEPTEKSIQIAASGNEIIFYYTKRTDLSYTVNYLLKDDDEDNSNNKVLHEANNVLNQTYKDEIITSDEIIEIFGYKFDSIDKEKLVIDIEKNEINIFYTVDEAQTKDLSYTVEYYINGVKQENDTVVVTEPVQVLQPDTLPMKQELIDVTKYTGYELDSSNQIPDIVNNGDTVKINYTNKTFSYKVQYYFNGYIDNSLTVEKQAKYLDVIDTYEDKMKEGYKFDIVENLPLTVTENEEANIIKVYYKSDQTVVKEVTYEILYYKDGEVVDRRVVTRKVQILLPDKVAVDKNLIETDRYNDADFIKTEPAEIPNLIESGEIISVYYESKISQVVVKYVDQVTGEIIDQEVLEGKVGEEYSIQEKEFDGYTLIESSELEGTYTEEPQEKVFYYAKNAEVTVKYLEKDTDEVLDSEEIITGYEGKEFETIKKDIEDYELVEVVGIPSGTMSAGDSEVIYYYAQKTRVIVNYIDILKNENIDYEIIEGKVGDEYEAIPKDFDRYILIDKDEEESNLLPENSTGIMTKDEIVVNYYYKQISEGVLEKHIDKVTNEILENTLYEGNVGDEYTTTPKEFEGYDLDEENLPENSQGVMTEELIEVKYYYMRKAQVKVQYLDRNTNEAIAEELLIEGHEGDEYETEPEDIEEYYLVESMMPENSVGTMTKDEIIVRYYYAKKSAGVIEKHIDKNTEEILEENFYEGLVGDEYKILSKEFEGYDLDKTNLPENSVGKMTEEVIEVNYYYERIATVKVEYIDENTDEVLESQILKGHEGDEYKTSPKSIKDYKLDKEKMPENAEGIMEVTKNEDGNITSEIIVKYYYKKVSAGVLEKHIDIKTDDVLEEQFYSGNENDDYKTSAKEYKEYDLVKEKMPENAEGKMTVELTEVDYYYIRKATVRVQYVDNKTGKKISEDTIIKGNEDDEYKTTAKEIKNYTLDKKKLPENAEGIMKVERSEHLVEDVKTETVVTYYYDKVEKEEPNKPDEKPTPEEKPDNGNNKPDKNPGENNTNNNTNNESNNIIINTENNTNNRPNNNSNNVIVITKPSTDTQNTPSKNEKPKDEPTKIPLPSTGDKVPVIAISIIAIVSMVNIIQIIISKKKKDKK